MAMVKNMITSLCTLLGLPLDVTAQIYPPTISSSDALESILEKHEIAGSCLKCIQCIMSEVRCKTTNTI